MEVCVENIYLFRHYIFMCRTGRHMVNILPRSHALAWECILGLDSVIAKDATIVSNGKHTGHIARSHRQVGVPTGTMGTSKNAIITSPQGGAVSSMALVIPV